MASLAKLHDEVIAKLVAVVVPVYQLEVFHAELRYPALEVEVVHCRTAGSSGKDNSGFCSSNSQPSSSSVAAGDVVRRFNSQKRQAKLLQPYCMAVPT
jgi:hypothetical protein